MSDKTYSLSTPIYYINAVPHIGHAYTSTAADVLARYHRKQGREVLFSTGTDENSKKTTEAAEKAGQDPRTYTDEMAVKWQEVMDKLGISYDRFVRTTEEDHQKTTYALLERIQEAGDIYKGSYEGLYCVGCESFIKETDLVDGKCPDHNKEPEKLTEENYFFKLSKYGDQLLQHIKDNPDFVRPQSRRNEVVSFIEQGLEDISVTREKQDWGMRYPFDEQHVIYVWVEALINYLTVTGYPGEGFDKWWPMDAHLVGKDIIKFHCVYWPAMLLSAGLPLPKTVVANGFINVGGVKISKSLGNAVDPIGLSDEYGLDALRYYVMSQVPYGADGDFTLEHFHDVYNAHLANELGNLVQRTATMARRYLESGFGEVPKGSLDEGPYHQAFADYQLDKAINHVWTSVRALNQYVEENKPWELAKADDQDKLKAVLLHLVGGILQVSELLEPFLPETADKIAKTFSGGKVNPDVGILFPKLETES